MAVILGNKYQSKNRDNFRKITGLSEANEKIKPENMPRIFGGIGEVYFNGQSAAGQSTGNGGDSGGGSGGSGGSGGGSGSGGGGSSNCTCEKIDEIKDGLIAKPCCLSGVDCETGTPIKIQLDPSETPIIPCETPKPPPPPTESCETVVITYYQMTGMATPSKTVYLLSTIDSVAGDLENALQQSVDSIQSVCGGGAVVREYTTTSDLFCNGVDTQITYVHSRHINTQNCGLISGDCNLITRPTIEQYQLGLQNWNKKINKNNIL